MQRGARVRSTLRKWRISEEVGCGIHVASGLLPAEIPQRVIYRVQVRNPAPSGRDSWATYVKSARERVGMTKTELARRLRVDRATVARWESGANRPEDADLVSRFADMFGLDLDEALAAAGLRPAARPPRTPTKEPPLDPDLVTLMRRLADPNVSEAAKISIRATLRYLAGLAEREDPDEDEGRAAS